MNIIVYNSINLIIIFNNFLIIYYYIINTQIEPNPNNKLPNNILICFIISLSFFSYIFFYSFNDLKFIQFNNFNNLEYKYKIIILYLIICLVIIQNLIIILYYSQILDTIGYVLTPYILNTFLYLYLLNTVNTINI